MTRVRTASPRTARRFAWRRRAVALAALPLIAAACATSADDADGADDSTVAATTTPTTVAADEVEEAPATPAPTDTTIVTEVDAASASAEVESEATVVADTDGAVVLPESAFMSDYELMDDDHGAVVSVTIDGDQRVMVSNGLPNHDVGDFPNGGNPNTISEQDVDAMFPVEPVFVGVASTIKEPGVTVAGVKFDPGTAERATCADGTVYSIEALQDEIDLGLDFNNAHVQPTGAYHYHGESELVADALVDSDEDLVHIGFMYDGFPVYYSHSNAYTSSYALDADDRDDTDCTWENPVTGEQVVFGGPTPDGSLTQDWTYEEGSGDLDECNGTFIGDEYVYFVTDTFPYISRCLMGEVSDDAAGPAPDGQGPPPGDGQGPPPEGTQP